MHNSLVSKGLEKDIAKFLEEDDLTRNLFYTKQLPHDLVSCSLNFKSDMVIAGLPYFFEVFKYLGARDLRWELFEKYEGAHVKKDPKTHVLFQLPFAIALYGERIALNLLQHASSISTVTHSFVEKAKPYHIAILDTRKTLPGLRSLEKYAVRVGGGHNHRLGQSDLWMVKDNHKNFFGGIRQAVAFFKAMQGFYVPIEVEIHDLNEFKEAIELKIPHVMLDNFSPEQVREAIKLKPSFMTIEISGGINLTNIEGYLMTGVDAISIGALTYAAPQVDVSLKYKREK